MGNNSAPVKDNCTLFAPTPYFRARAIRWCHLNLSPANPRCHGNKFWDKSDYNSVCRQSHFPPADLRCRGNKIWDRIGYSSACVRDICNIFASIRGFSGMGHRMLPTEFFPERPTLPWQRNFGHIGLQLGFCIRWGGSRLGYFGMGSAQLLESAHMHPAKIIR